MTNFDDLNLKIPSILDILAFMSILNFMLSRFEHEKCLIISVPDQPSQKHLFAT